MSIRPLTERDKPFIKQTLANLWGSEQIVYSGHIIDASTLPGFLAEEKEKRIVGLITYEISDSSCQIISLNALVPGKGIGTALLEKVKQIAKEMGLYTITVRTTNDNLAALKFYQKRGFVLKSLHPNAVKKSRLVKPQIPLIGEEGIPLRDELELERAI